MTLRVTPPGIRESLLKTNGWVPWEICLQRFVGAVCYLKVSADCVPLGPRHSYPQITRFQHQHIMNRFARLLTGVAIALMASAFGSAAIQGWNANDDQKLAQAVGAVLKQDQAGLHRVTKKTFRMSDRTAALCKPIIPAPRHSPHFEYYCHVYVNHLALEPMNSGTEVYPEGSLIIKQKFSDQRGTKTELFTVMRKMGRDYDPENHDWEYSIVDASAKTVLSRGRTDSCIHCHADYASTDYVTRIYLSPKSK